MAYRSRMSRGGSKRMFRSGAARVHPKNHLSSSGSKYVMRGGIRL